MLKPDPRSYKRKIPANTQMTENPIAPTIPRMQHTKNLATKKDLILIPVNIYRARVP